MERFLVMVQSSREYNEKGDRRQIVKATYTLILTGKGKNKWFRGFRFLF